MQAHFMYSYCIISFTKKKKLALIQKIYFHSFYSFLNTIDIEY